jgi:biopolymer transport protein ExbB
MMIAIFLQAAWGVSAATGAVPAGGAEIGLLELMMKGGWIMVPLLLLAVLALFLMFDTWFSLRRTARVGRKWYVGVMEKTRGGDFEEAMVMIKSGETALARLFKAGLTVAGLPDKQIEEDVQVEARQIIARVEAPVGYLSMIASIAPMLGFLGTIFGVIKIFINISLTNDLSISSIADGLYQKMICSGAGLLVGIVAYAGCCILNRRLDRMALMMDKGGNELLKAIACGLSSGNAVRRTTRGKSV